MPTTKVDKIMCSIDGKARPQMEAAQSGDEEIDPPDAATLKRDESAPVRDLMARNEDIDARVYTPGCVGRGALRRGAKPHAHTPARRRRLWDELTQTDDWRELLG